MTREENVNNAHQAMLEVVHSLSAEQRRLIFENSPLSNSNVEPISKTLDFRQVTKKSQIADVAAQLSYAKAICRLLEYFYADTLPIEVPEDEIVSSGFDLCA